MAFIRAFIGFLFAIMLTVFAVYNRHDVSVNLGPTLPSYEFPLYLIVLGFMAVGFVFGGIFVWLNGASVRRSKRKQRKEIKALEREVDDLKFSNHDASAPIGEFFPALPSKKG